MGENLPRISSIFLMAIGVLVCIMSQVAEYDFNYSNSLGFYDFFSTFTFCYLFLFILGAATVMIGIILALWNSDRGKLKEEIKEEIKEELEAERRKSEGTE